MNLFDLFVKIGVKDEASDHISQIKATTVAAGQLMANAATAAGKALVNLGKQAFEGYAEYEQLTGGVETLFKESALEVQGYADRAYKTAGLSANEYMSTVTSFSASLLQSLSGDTEAAAKLADQAIIDMSDNANKMGTSMESIQNAYQGFAKQNYTMLDNLKLGYGGTKEEMARLLEDAARLKGLTEEDAAMRGGKNALYDISNFADIVEAIHVVQESVGIAGATAAEAEGTISGSVAAMKAQWQNLLTAFAGDGWDVGVFFNNFVESVKTVAANVIPVVKTLLVNIGQTLADNGPEMLANGVVMLGKFALGIVKAIPDVVSKIPELIAAIVEEFKENGPEILQIGKDIVSGIYDGIKSMISWLEEKIGDFVGGIVDNVKGVLGIRSPSRVFAGIGENMALGLGNGWEREFGSVSRQVTDGLDFGTGHVGFAKSGIGRSSAGIINGFASVPASGGNMTVNLMMPDGNAFARYYLSSFIDVAKSNGTPIVNPT